MRTAIASLALAGVALACGVAHAQTAWQSPDGVFAVTIPPGWEVVPHASSQDSETRSRWLSFSRRSESGYNRCDLWKWNERRDTPVTQADINGRVPRTLEAWGGGPEGVTVREFRSDIESGVGIIRYSGDASVGGVSTQRHFAVFVVAHANTVTEYTIRCDLTQPASSEDSAAAAGFSNSVTFSQ